MRGDHEKDNCGRCAATGDDHDARLDGGSGRHVPGRDHEIFYNSPGPDRGSNASLNAEWIQLRNSSGHSVTLTHWTLRDRAGYLYTFGTCRLNAHGSVKIHTGGGSNTQTNRYWGHSWYIWNNNGDGATLKNASGTVVSRCSYSDPGENSASKIC
jgi:lamin tail-like protein